MTNYTLNDLHNHYARNAFSARTLNRDNAYPLEYWAKLSVKFFVWLRENWVRIVLVAIIALLITDKEINFQVNLNSGQTALISSTTDGSKPEAFAMSTALTEEVISPMPEETKAVMPIAKKKNKPRIADKAKKAAYQKYVKRFAPTAVAEMKKFGIPASITLAQGLLESNTGKSRLAVKNNNHFGIKCFSRSCKKGHCSNFEDDSHKDFFRQYGTAWESYRAHSMLLQSKRYLPLKKLAEDDYKAWAKGLKAAGYATDPHYAQKLIHLIEALDLEEYDSRA